MRDILNRRLNLPFYMIILLLCLSAGSTLAQDFSNARPERLGMDGKRLERLDDALQSYIDNDQLAGSVTLVLRHGRIAYASAKGMRDRESGSPMQEDSIFRIASQTKAIVSTGIMMLQERGQLLISDPLSKYIPAWADAKVAVPGEDGAYRLVPLRRPVTLRDLLTHSSGIGYGTGGIAADAWKEAGIQNWYLAGRDEPILDTVTLMADLPQEAQPGERWIYGYNIDILGAVIEVVSGQSLAAFLENEIFQPLGMRDTHFFLPETKADRLAVVYSSKQGGGLERNPDQGDYVNGPRISYSGGAGLLSTAGDYARFLQMLLNGGELFGHRLLSPTTVALMTTTHYDKFTFRAGEGMGLGFSVLKDLGLRGTPGSVGEYGWGGAYHSTYWVDPEEELVVVYLTQLLPALAIDDSSKLRSGIYQAIVE